MEVTQADLTEALTSFRLAVRVGRGQESREIADPETVASALLATLSRMAAERGPDDAAPGLARFDSDPDALAWARSYVQRRTDQFRQFEAAARDRGGEEMASRWRMRANLLQADFIGGQGCVIAAFDERKPSLPHPGGVAW